MGGATPMTLPGLLQIAVLAVLAAGFTKPLGFYMARVFAGERTVLHRLFGLAEYGLYRVSGVDPAQEQSWLDYALSLLALTLALAMFLGRFLVIVPVLAIAGSLAAKSLVPASAGTLPATGGVFIALLTCVIVIIGGLTFLPALTLGPVAEHLAMQAGLLF